MRRPTENLDEHSGYIAPGEYEEFQRSLDQRFGGIGVRIERTPSATELIVRGLIVNSPAAKAGLRAGDLITAIDNVKLDDSPLREIVKRIHGPIGTKVTLTLRRAGVQEPLNVDVVRDEIQTDSVLGDARRADGSWDFFFTDKPRIAYIRITTFGERTAEELRAALNATNDRGERAEAVIIDLRDNAGGLLTAAIQAADMLLDRGVIVSTRGRDGAETRRYTARPDLVLPPAIPLAVLINRNSASASEILAACLQDHGRAIMVGERSFGKGTVQNIIPLEGGRSALKLTTASYWRPSNKNIHRRTDARDTDDWGVSPLPADSIPIDKDQWERILRYRLYRDDHRDDPPQTSNATPTGTPLSNPDSVVAKEGPAGPTAGPAARPEGGPAAGSERGRSAGPDAGPDAENKTANPTGSNVGSQTGSQAGSESGRKTEPATDTNGAIGAAGTTGTAGATDGVDGVSSPPEPIMDPHLSRAIERLLAAGRS